jgi:O-antigen/teichoic acid export membrane protein
VSVRRQVAVNVGSNWAAIGVSALVSFFLAPFVVHSLGSTAYGAWTLVGSLVGYLGLVDLGVRGAVTKYVSTHHAAGDHGQASRVTSAGLLFFGLAGILAVLVAAVVALGIDRFFEVPPGLVGPMQLAIVLSGLTVAVSMIGGVFGGVVVGLQRFELLNSIEIGANLTRAAAVVYALSNGGGLVALASIQLTLALARALAQTILAHRLYPQLELDLLLANTHLKRVVLFGLTTFLLHLSATLAHQTDALVIGYFMPLSAVTIYGIALSLAEMAGMVFRGVSQVITPMTANLEGRGELGRVGDVTLRAGRLATLMTLPVLITFVVRGDTFIHLWMGPEYGAPSGELLALLAIGLWGASSYQVLTSAIIGIGRHRGLLAAFACEALANFALSVALIGVIGLPGVAIGTMVPRLATSLVFAPAYARRVLGTPILVYLWQGVVRTNLAMLPFALGTWAVEEWSRPSGLVRFFAEIAAVLPLAVFGAWVLGLSRDERVTVKGALLSRLPRAARR